MFFFCFFFFFGEHVFKVTTEDNDSLERNVGVVWSINFPAIFEEKSSNSLFIRSIVARCLREKVPLNEILEIKTAIVQKRLYQPKFILRIIPCYEVCSSRFVFWRHKNLIYSVSSIDLPHGKNIPRLSLKMAHNSTRAEYIIIPNWPTNLHIIDVYNLVARITNNLNKYSARIQLQVQFVYTWNTKSWKYSSIEDISISSTNHNSWMTRGWSHQVHV